LDTGGEISTAMIWLIFLNWMLFLLVVAFLEAEQVESKTNQMTATPIQTQKI
jgi:hypothetical protein